jgi:hypothetical protein
MDPICITEISYLVQKELHQVAQELLIVQKVDLSRKIQISLRSIQNHEAKSL